MVLALDDFAHFEASWEPKATAHPPHCRDAAARPRQLRLLRRQPGRARARPAGAAPRSRSSRCPTIRPSTSARSTPASGSRRSSLTERGRAARRRSTRRAAAARAADAVRVASTTTSVARDGRRRPADRRRTTSTASCSSSARRTSSTSRPGARPRGRAALLADPGAVGVTLRLRDRFGDHGLVAVMIVVAVADATATTLDDRHLADELPRHRPDRRAVLVQRAGRRGAGGAASAA